MESPPIPGDYVYIEDVEDIDRYRLDGYHPIHIDDRLNKRYRIAVFPAGTGPWDWDGFGTSRVTRGTLGLDPDS
ncbi:hypothetical protein E4U34_000207 [Claviceps purpurea]|nr:hypothetical protein E4U34_000207 [Claviceps purpurea]